jgi:serine/alanine adding enzyme
MTSLVCNKEKAMNIEILDSEDYEWNEYVSSSYRATGAHLAGWRRVFERSFGHQSFYLMARDGGRVVGVLPLVLMKSRLFGRFLVSVPFLNYGGICAEDPISADSLLEAAIELAEVHGSTHIELRHQGEQRMDLPSRDHKVAMVLDLPDHWEDLWAGFRAKVRSQIRRPEKEGMYCTVGGVEKLDEFYEVFAHNMRDLGTPVYSKTFFENVLLEFPQKAHILTTMYGDRPVAAGIVFGHNGTLEIPWASSLRAYNHFAGNMLLYWTALKFACEQGFRRFDFGRSTPGEGTYRFKAQWGAAPVTLTWQYWLSKGEALPDITPKNPKYRLAIRIWRRLPIPVTRVVGPLIVKSIP